MGREWPKGHSPIFDVTREPVAPHWALTMVLLLSGPEHHWALSWEGAPWNIWALLDSVMRRMELGAGSVLGDFWFGWECRRGRSSLQ